MAKFTLAGKADCPYFAKAELLADALQRRLPDFTVHKISVLPEDWAEWLEATCERRGWKHEDSPLVWRDLVVQGGKAMLLGGFSDFLEHCQEHYGVTSDMSTDVMLGVAAENLQARRSRAAEEQRRVGLVQPLHVWISGALSPTCLALIPRMLSAETFPRVSVFSLHLLDLDGSEEDLEALRTDTEDLALGALRQVTIHTDVARAFRDADVVVLLDDGAAGGEGRDAAMEISGRYRQYGRLIHSRAQRTVKVIVCGDALVNLRCSLLLDAASIDGRQFIAVATQLENEAKAVLAKQLRVKSSDVTGVIVWGNISGLFHIDLQMAKVFNHDGPIRGPRFFSQPVLKLLHERKWLETDLHQLTGRERGAVAAKTGRAAGMAAANGVLGVLRAWNGVGGSQEVLSAGVLSTGRYNVPDGVVFSAPVVFREGKCCDLDDVTVPQDLQEKLQLSVRQLLQEKELAEENK